MMTNATSSLIARSIRLAKARRVQWRGASTGMCSELARPVSGLSKCMSAACRNFIGVSQRIDACRRFRQDFHTACLVARRLYDVARLTIPAEYSAHDRPRRAGFDDLSGVGALLSQIRRQRVRQIGQRHRLQPDPPWAGELHEKNPVAAEQRVLDATDRCDIELNTILEHADVPGMHKQRFAGLQRAVADFATERDPGLTDARQTLQDKALTAEDAAAE